MFNSRNNYNSQTSVANRIVMAGKLDNSNEVMAIRPPPGRETSKRRMQGAARSMNASQLISSSALI